MVFQSEEETSSTVTWEELYHQIDRLPEVYRSAVVLCHLEGLSHEQAAGRLGCPLRTLQSRLLRARARLARSADPPGSEPARGFPAAAETGDSTPCLDRHNFPGGQGLRHGSSLFRGLTRGVSGRRRPGRIGSSRRAHCPDDDGRGDFRHSLSRRSHRGLCARRFRCRAASSVRERQFRLLPRLNRKTTRRTARWRFASSIACPGRRLRASRSESTSTRGPDRALGVIPS